MFDPVPRDQIVACEKGLLDHIKAKHDDIRSSIRTEKQITAETEAKLSEVISAYVSANY